MSKNKIVFLSLSILSLVVHGQTHQDIIKTARKQFQEINADTTLKKISLDSEEFLDHVPDGGGELTGFFKGDSIVKIAEWIGVSYGNRIREYYYKQDKLFFIFEKFESFVEKNGELDHEKVKTSFEGRYYFDHEKLVEQKISGKRAFENNATDILKELQQEARDNFQLLLSRRSKDHSHS
jgi:hypothetical protein